MKLHIGTSGFGYKEWKGRFYPEKLPAKQMLHFYAERFDAVEINNTFRGMVAASVLENWAAEVPADFCFVLKAPMRITHIKRLKDVGDAVTELFDTAATLKKRLGPVLFQLPPNMKADAARLGDFLATLPTGSRAAFEFRHASWFNDDVLAVLRQHKAALCFAEADDNLETPFVATANWGYVRLRRADYSDADLRDWLARIAAMKWREAFVFFKHEDEANGPRMAARLRELAG